MKKYKKDTGFTKEIREEIGKGIQSKEVILFLDGPTITRNYENAQLILRYEPFLKSFHALKESNDLSDNSIKELLRDFNSVEIFEEIREFANTGKISSRPKSTKLKLLTRGRNSREAWLSFRLFGIFNRVAALPLSEYIGFYSNRDGGDPAIEPMEEPPASFPQNDFSVNYLLEEKAIEMFFRFKNGEYYSGKIEALVEAISALAYSYFGDYKPIPGLDRKLRLIDIYEREKLKIDEENKEDRGTGEKIEFKLYAKDAVIEMLDSDSESMDDDEILELSIDKGYALIRKYKSEIAKIQKERFVNKV
jgi:hypothetical protein